MQCVQGAVAKYSDLLILRTTALTGLNDIYTRANTQRREINMKSHAKSRTKRVQVTRAKHGMRQRHIGSQ